MIRDRDDLHRSYDESGEMLMHLQKAVDRLRALRPGADDRPGDDGDEVPARASRCTTGMPWRTASCRADVGSEAVTIAQTVNAFFRWEFNSCEMLVKDGVVYPIDYANACPDVAVTSLHYYFPWAMKALLRWSVYCLATGRKPRTQVDTGPWFAVADDESLDYAGQARRLPGAGRRLLRDRALPGVLRDGAAARRRDGPGVGGLRRLPQAPARARSSRPTRPTSGSASRATSAG